MREFKDRLSTSTPKTCGIDRERLNEVGILAHPSEYHTPKLPGLGDVDWGRFFSALTDAGYNGPVCVEVEDRAYEASLDTRKASCGKVARTCETSSPLHALPAHSASLPLRKVGHAARTHGSQD